MKYTLFFLLIYNGIFAQNFSAIKLKTDKYPQTLTAEKLSEKIVNDFTSDEDKVKGAFCWITKNISYDLKELYNPNRKKKYKIRYRTQEELQKIKQNKKDSIVSLTFRTRKGVCQNFAETFSKTCSLLNIENNLVTGYTRQSTNEINNPPQLGNHVWNVVKINNKYIFIDPTWAAGHEQNGQWIRAFNPYYYNIPNKNYFKTHYPEDDKWSLRVGRMSLDDFYKQPIYNSSIFGIHNIEIVSENGGILYRNRKGEVNFKLKNRKLTQQVLIGLDKNPMAQKPKITKQNGVTNVSIYVPKNIQELHLIIDMQLVSSFKVF